MLPCAPWNHRKFNTDFGAEPVGRDDSRVVRAVRQFAILLAIRTHTGKVCIWADPNGHIPGARLPGIGAFRMIAPGTGA